MRLDDSLTWAHDVAWIGNDCVLYQAGKGTNPFVRNAISVFIFNIKTGKSLGALEVLGLSDQALDGLVSYNYPNAIVKSVVYSQYDVTMVYSLVSPDGTRTSLKLEDPSAVQLLPDKQMDDMPSECK
ncbi:MAG: hypothetical protein ABSA32_13310 [Candidatus Acidiferrales bacterium]|jgi:hypothetical protein